MCSQCGFNNCSCSSSSELSYESPTEGSSSLSGFPYGHPIIMIDDTSDLALFSFVTGEGSGVWENWAVCDGQSHLSTTGATINTPDLRNNFVIGAGDTYTTGDVGGEATVTLDESMIPIHSHVLTDAGHTHTATNASHTHNLTDPGHTHTVTDPGHTHPLTMAADGDHDHTVTIETQQVGNTAQAPDTLVYVPDAGTATDTETTDTEADHSHAGSTVDSAVTGATIVAASTGITMATATPVITVDSAETGILMENTGGGQPHENLPPFYALVFIKYIG